MIPTNRLIGPDTREVLAYDVSALSPYDALNALAYRNRRLATLSAESDSFARLGWGLLAWGVTVLGVLGLAAALWDGAPAVLRLVGVVVAFAGLGCGALLGRDVWRAGRSVVDAFVAWTLLPERLAQGGAGVADWRADPVRDAVRARVFVFEGWRVLRIVAAVAAFLVTPMLGDQLQRTPADQQWWAGQTASVTVFVLGLLVVSMTVVVVLMGGQWRANRAHARRDPVQRRLLGR
ncbi:hypothetical protein ACIPEP_01255 [Curtobacterium sp. NPDC087082]|uniref:hypothetical protein n=1 Tax=Curtobacterium sp. NPDC087082 TaxID=3363966 RepID=UPI003802CCC2